MRRKYFKTFQTINKIIKKIKKFEIILIDDFSDDSTINILNKISNQNKNVTVIKNKIKGLGGAINLGIQDSKYKYIAIMMADLSDDPYDLIRYYYEISKNNLDVYLEADLLEDLRLSITQLKAYLQPYI